MAASPDPQALLRDYCKTREFFVGIESDGCAFDTLEVKHKECFIPNTVKSFGLAAVSKYAREASEFVNLYSKWRGIYRFPGLTMTLDLLGERPEVTRRMVQVPALNGPRRWLERDTTLANSALSVEVAATGDPDLALAYEWSEAVNRSVGELVRESLERMAGTVDVMVVSATPSDALNHEWEEHGLARHVSLIAGQEMGSKKEHLALATVGRYDPRKVLMIGDAPGDRAAAEANGALFFPILSGREDASWQQFFRRGSPPVLGGNLRRRLHGRPGRPGRTHPARNSTVEMVVRPRHNWGDFASPRPVRPNRADVRAGATRQSCPPDEPEGLRA